MHNKEIIDKYQPVRLAMKYAVKYNKNEISINLYNKKALDTINIKI